MSVVRLPSLVEFDAIDSVEAEESVIGGLLVHSRKFDEVSPVLGAEDFSHPALRAIYDAMVELNAQSRPIDPLTVAERMRSMGTFENLRAFNGADYLTDLMAKVVTVENIGYHAGIINKKAHYRRKHTIAVSLSAACTKGDDEQIEFYEQRLADEHRRATRPQLSVLRSAADVEMKPVEWLWRWRIPRGMLSMFDGDPGLCKSTVIVDLAARLSRGEPLPGDRDSRGPANTILISFEDTAAHVIKPRLVVAGADCSRVALWDQDENPFNVSDSLVLLGQMIEQFKASWVVIDPLMSAFPASLNAHRDQDVRAVLAPLSKLAERTDCAITFVRHLNKSGGGSALYRGGGSIGIIAAARAGMLLARDPDADQGEDAEDDGTRVLAMTKCNVGRSASAVRLRVVSAPPPAPGIEVARIEWGGTVKASADTLVAPREENSVIGKAVDLLRNLMKDGPITAGEGHAALEANGVSQRSEARAKERLGIVTKREGIKGKWWWHLPEHLPPGQAATEVQ